MTILVDGTINLPSNSYDLYSGLNNVTVDFQNQPFYVYSATGSTINVNSNSQAGRLTVQNVNLQNSGSSNTASWIGRKYYTTNKGILFSST